MRISKKIDAQTQQGEKQKERAYEYNSFVNLSGYINDSYGVYNCLYDVETVRMWLQNPQKHYSKIREFSNYVYSSNGMVANVIDYMASMHTLDMLIYIKNSKGNQKFKKEQSKKQLFKTVLDSVRIKQKTRDCILRSAIDGMAFYYFEVKQGKQKAINLTDYDIDTMVEINNVNANYSLIPLPVEYTKIVGIKNESYVLAFDLDYFSGLSETMAKRRLLSFPSEIRDAYLTRKDRDSRWVVLDNNNTVAVKIKSKLEDCYGLPLATPAFDSILYADEFVNTKRDLLKEVVSKLIYQIFPEGDKVGTSSLSGEQQRAQHEALVSATTRGVDNSGVRVVSLASGTKIDSIDVDIGLFDEKNERNLNSNISSALGFAISALTGDDGNYAAQTNNLTLVASQVYTWMIEPFVDEINKVINANVIKDKKYKVEMKYLDTTIITRDKTIGYAKDLYTLGKGSIQSWVTATGYNVDGYFSLLDEELELDFENKYPAHQTSFNTSSPASEGGRPESSDSTNSSTIQTKSNNSNDNPKPST